MYIWHLTYEHELDFAVVVALTPAEARKIAGFQDEDVKTVQLGVASSNFKEPHIVASSVTPKIYGSKGCT